MTFSMPSPSICRRPKKTSALTTGMGGRLVRVSVLGIVPDATPVPPSHRPGPGLQRWFREQSRHFHRADCKMSLAECTTWDLKCPNARPGNWRPVHRRAYTTPTFGCQVERNTEPG